MGWRKTGKDRPPEEVLILTCDICECDIGHEDGRRARAHFQITQHPNVGAFGRPEATLIVCSAECLRAFASRCVGPHR
jgi:hypothetical protein